MFSDAAHKHENTKTQKHKLTTSNTWINALAGRTVLVVGDVMIDRYLFGSVHRISPEAPVPVVLHRGTEDRLGGAANVALNIHALGSTPILCSVTGDDPEATALKYLLPRSGIGAQGLVSSPTRSTTIKTRVLGNNQQMLRIDREDTHDLSPEEESSFLAQIHNVLDNHAVEAIVFQDYNKGVLTPNVIKGVLREAKARDIYTTVDPKKANFFEYEGVTLFKPNLKEIRDRAPFPIQAEANSLGLATNFLRERLKNQWTMITLSEKGLYLAQNSTGRIFPTQTRSVADVSGAGDTVIAVATLALAAGLGMEAIGVLSNLAGGQVCQFSGVVPVQKALLEKALEQIGMV